MTGGEKQSVRGRRDVRSRSLGGSLSGSEEGTAPTLPPEERDALSAKMFLMSTSDPDEPSLYEHMAKLIADVLDKKHGDTMDLFEHISKFMKIGRIHVPQLSLKTHVEKSQTETLASAQWNLLEKSKRVAETQALELTDDSPEKQRLQSVPNLARQAAYFEMAGVGLPREEFVRIALSLNDLIQAYPTIQNIRFWGKMFGTRKSYYIAETELSEHDLEDDFDTMDEGHGMISKARDNENADLNQEDFEEEDSTLFDDVILPEDLKPMYKAPPKIPCEPAGSGLNKRVYFVTYEPGLPWTRLPHVTPAQLQVARKIRKYFTGDLDSPVVSYPPFPGVERNYLRAQIARISASTHVSPLGYFRFDDEGEEEEEALGEEVGRDNMIVDSEYEGMAIRDLADGGLQAWVHHNPAILPQGRTTWWNPVQPKEDFNEDEENEEEEEERQEPDEPEPEVGPPLLTPLAEDDSIGYSPGWFAASSSKFVPEFSVAVLQSNVWIGAYAFAAEKGRFFENIYIGWGQKNLGTDFEPAVPDNPLVEFPSGPEITEADDPTPEEEAAVRAAAQEKELEAEFEQNVQDDDDDDIVDDDGEGGDHFDED